MIFLSSTWSARAGERTISLTDSAVLSYEHGQFHRRCLVRMFSSDNPGSLLCPICRCLVEPRQGGVRDGTAPQFVLVRGPRSGNSEPAEEWLRVQQVGVAADKTEVLPKLMSCKTESYLLSPGRPVSDRTLGTCCHSRGRWSSWRFNCCQSCWTRSRNDSSRNLECSKIPCMSCLQDMKWNTAVKEDVLDSRFEISRSFEQTCQGSSRNRCCRSGAKVSESQTPVAEIGLFGVADRQASCSRQNREGPMHAASS